MPMDFSNSVCVFLLAVCVFISPNRASEANGKDILTTNPRPIIGILAQATGLRHISKYGKSFIAASYVKFVEAGGARVVPILVNQTEDYYNKLFHSINGVIFPGGGQNEVSPDFGVGRSAAYFYKQAMKSFSEGDYFPIYGICFGFELLAMLTENFSCLESMSASDISLPLNFSSGYEHSKMFGKTTTPPEILEILRTQNVTYNAHKKGLSSKTFHSSDHLKHFYTEISTNWDKNDVEFISTMEGVKYPFYATQWHPEKILFEWNTNSEKHIPHSEDAVKVAQYMARFIVQEARKNNHKFASPEEEQASLIYQYQPVYTGDINICEQNYFFS
ncbi:Gamma-glutamyl hydrolase [Holothuria leucospilota]|uniref:folate gamma-glutamyl hydrolase n=1 Tax=Holothuria leucospilota TaxID=206669 RepID=A0A9Q1C4T9_HOLLE|nr:Gamma-glutamyl hydrolase [Holothuria leucospilota]